MAGIFTSIKNALFFALFAIPGIFIFQLLQDYATDVIEYYAGQGAEIEKAASTQAFYIRIASLVLLFFLCGIPLFKFLSDTVEDGVVEF